MSAYSVINGRTVEIKLSEHFNEKRDHEQMLDHLFNACRDASKDAPVIATWSWDYDDTSDTRVWINGEIAWVHQFNYDDSQVFNYEHDCYDYCACTNLEPVKELAKHGVLPIFKCSECGSVHIHTEISP